MTLCRLIATGSARRQANGHEALGPLTFLGTHWRTGIIGAPDTGQALPGRV